MTNEDGRRRRVSDEHDQLARMYRTVWWGKTRGMITTRFVHRSDRLLGLIDGVSECDKTLCGDIEAEIERIRNEAMTPPSCKMTPRQKAIWDAAMDFFLDPTKLTHSITSDEAVRGLKPEVKQKQGLRVILRSYFNARRRETEGMTEHEHRVWVKLHPISNDVILEYARRHGHLRAPGYRCCAEHANEVRTRILQEMPNDRLVGNIKATTIKEYFDRFCHECRELTDEEFGRLHPGEPPADGVMGLSPELKEATLRQLKERIEQLVEPLRSVVQASLQPDKGAKYRTREGMENGEFKRLLRLATQELCRRLGPEE